MPKLFIIVNEDRFFLSHRKPIAEAALKANYDVTIIAKNTGHKKDIQQLGFHFIDLPINPTGMNLNEEYRTFKFLYSLYRKNRPDIVHHVGLKNILWGGLAAKLSEISAIVNAVSGLGGLFNGEKLSFVNRIILRIIKFSNNRPNVKVIFQNKEDLSIFLGQNAVMPNQVEFIKGSGIDLNDFDYKPAPSKGLIKIIFTARMVKEKGVCDLITAAEILKPEFLGKIQFLLCGRLTNNRTGITKDYMSDHCDGEYICWLGERNDIKSLLENCHIMAFPSYYREGVPKSLIEASAIGRPIITCDSIGCRDVVNDGVNGFLIPPQNPEKLAQKLRILILNTALRSNMGQASREKALKEFSIKDVINLHLNIYNNLIGRNTLSKLS